MANIGFCGGNSTFTLGPSTDVVLFFKCISQFAVEKYPEHDWSLLTDRFYKRYIKKNEMRTCLHITQLH